MVEPISTTKALMTLARVLGLSDTLGFIDLPGFSDIPGLSSIFGGGSTDRDIFQKGPKFSETLLKEPYGLKNPQNIAAGRYRDLGAQTVAWQQRFKDSIPKFLTGLQNEYDISDDDIKNIGDVLWEQFYKNREGLASGNLNEFTNELQGVASLMGVAENFYRTGGDETNGGRTGLNIGTGGQDLRDWLNAGGDATGLTLEQWKTRQGTGLTNIGVPPVPVDVPVDTPVDVPVDTPVDTTTKIPRPRITFPKVDFPSLGLGSSMINIPEYKIQPFQMPVASSVGLLTGQEAEEFKVDVARRDYNRPLARFPEGKGLL